MPATAAQLDNARQQCARARTQLDGALLAGTDTDAARSALDAADARLSALTAPAPTAPDPTIGIEADALTAEATSRLQRALDGFAVPLPAVPDLRASISLALAVIEARRADTASSLALDEHAQEAARIGDRLAAISTARAALAARRLNGHAGDNDAAELRLLDLDEQGLHRLMAEHQARRPSDRPTEPAAQMAFSAAVELDEAAVLRRYGEALQAALLAVGDAIASRAHSGGERLRTDKRLAVAVRQGCF